MNKDTNQLVTGAVILIGDEILSGTTSDTNANFLAKELIFLGIDLEEVRIIADDSAAIIAAVNELRHAYTYVFTTGGIGPTHDDITTSAIAQAFGLELVLNTQAVKLIEQITRKPLNEPQLKMAYLPQEASLIYNSISGAPGWQLENVYVLAGVPAIMQDMFAVLKPSLTQASVYQSKTIDIYCSESTIAQFIAQLQQDNVQLKIGSYPQHFSAGCETFIKLVMRSRNAAVLEDSLQQLIGYLEMQQIKFVQHQV